MRWPTSTAAPSSWSWPSPTCTRCGSSRRTCARRSPSGCAATRSFLCGNQHHVDGVGAGNLVSTQATPRQRHRPHDTIGADDHAARGRHGLGPAEEQEQADDHGVRAGRPLREMARPVRPLTVQTMSKAPPPVPRARGVGSVMYTFTSMCTLVLKTRTRAQTQLNFT